MNSQPIVMDKQLSAILDVVEKRTIAFMRDELGLVSQGVTRHTLFEERVVLRSLTAIVAVGSTSGLYIAYSYDESLIRAMTKRYTAELSIAEKEEELYLRETASDVVNVIVGNCTADLGRRGEPIALSPPVLMPGARTIESRPKTTIAVMTLQFPEGMLDIAFVGPKILFDEQLNYKDGAH